MSKPSWLPLTLFFDAPGPFTVEVAKFSSMLIGTFFILFLVKEGQMLADFPWKIMKQRD
jgi:hypothetical protein